MEDWKEVKLGDLATVKGGKRLPKGSNLTTQRNSHPYIRIRDLGKSKILQLNSEYEYVDDETQKTISRYITNKGDVLISIVGTIGLIGIVGDSLDNANLTENCVKLVDLHGVDTDYLYYYLISEIGQNEITRGTVGAVQPKLPIKNIQDINIYLPPLPAQQKIAQILSSLDDKIELNNKINANLEQQAQALFKSWFVDFEPFGGEMPVGWKEVGFKDICINITDGVHNTVVDDPNGTYLLLSCKNIKGGVLSISSDERLINEETFLKLRKRTKLEKGDILLSSVGTIGEMFLLNEEPTNFEFQRSVAIIKPDNSKISSAFLYESMLQQKESIIHSAHGAVQQCIFISDIGDFKTILPTLEVIKKYTGIVQPMLDTITANQNENKKLSNLRDTLLPKLMNGEIEK